MSTNQTKPVAAALPRVTLKVLRQWVAEGRKFPVLTCYDATTAAWLERGGVRVLLVGDSAASVILGHEQSIFAPLEFLLTITAAVRRGAPGSFVMGDMPFMSYQADDAEAVRNAGRFLVEGLADAVKLEVDDRYVGLVEKLSRAGVPVVAHIGWKPQNARYAGVRTAVVAGRTRREIDALISTAIRMEQAGAVLVLVEQCTAEAGAAVVQAVRVPVIGCGAGPACHGHVVVLQDALGMTEQRPSFVRPVGELGAALQAAAEKWRELVESGAYLRDDHPYPMRER